MIDLLKIQTAVWALTAGTAAGLYSVRLYRKMPACWVCDDGSENRTHTVHADLSEQKRNCSGSYLYRRSLSDPSERSGKLFLHAGSGGGLHSVSDGAVSRSAGRQHLSDSP